MNPPSPLPHQPSPSTTISTPPRIRSNIPRTLKPHRLLHITTQIPIRTRKRRIRRASQILHLYISDLDLITPASSFAALHDRYRAGVDRAGDIYEGDVRDFKSTGIAVPGRDAAEGGALGYCEGGGAVLGEVEV